MINNEDIKVVVTTIATNVRNELDKMGSISNRCGDASRSIVKQLENEGISAELVKGVANLGLNEKYYHTWVEVGNLFVDVTLDQFNDRNPGGQVEKITVLPIRPRYLQDEWNN